MDKNLGHLILICTLLLVMFGAMMDVMNKDKTSGAHKFVTKISRTVESFFPDKDGCR